MRKSGILLPIFSLPSLYGIGCFGKDAYSFVDFLRKAGQSYWQILPIGPTGYGDSPYQSYSGTAGNPLFIDIELLMFDKLLSFDECREYCGVFNESKINYDLIRESREKLLRIAISRFDFKKAEYLKFCRDNENWLDDYAVFMSIKTAHNGDSLWLWDKQLQNKNSEEVARFSLEHKEEIKFNKAVQYIFYTQWFALKRYANKNGVEIIGDIPIYVSQDSSDFWAKPELFLLDERMEPCLVAGCPPDYFSEDGQLWGNPIYNWAYHKNTDYQWWIDRLDFSSRMFDVVRIDHFRGLYDFWAVPSSEKSAKNGCWLNGPADSFIDRIKHCLPKLKIIAEDLGKLNDGVVELLRYSSFPGMAVLQFAFDGDRSNTYLPYNLSKNTVAYTATHDNPTTLEWYNNLSDKQRIQVHTYLKTSDGRGTVDSMIDAVLSSVADTAVVPLFDYLMLDMEGRINVPSTVGDNWNVRIRHELITDELAETVNRKTSIYGRC
ncbi:MAG: 4-alpha-glucanotransferase [Oscillospiraceae bacterium]